MHDKSIPVDKRLKLYLIKPSKYDDDGYVIRHWKGVLPSNTLNCLYTLSHQVRSSGALGEDLKWQITALDETVQKIDIRKIVRASREAKSKTVVCLVGVQSNQFLRAADLAHAFRAAGIDVLIGGFHVSGIMATLPELTPELQALREAGVTLVGGEVEHQWENLLRDALKNELRPVYNFLREPPELDRAPVPYIPKHLLNRYAVRHFATLDCGRGCPFQCSFCTVINVQGRHMRFRPVPAILDRIRDNYSRHKIHSYFFTDDNFCRNKNWEAIFDGLIRLREEDGIRISFMIQVDTLSYRIPGFVEKAGRAGCAQVFIGMESLNAANLKAVGKNQNHTDAFKELIEAYQRAGIVTHLAYIIGFPFDTEASVRDDMEKLQALGAEQSSFFMLTPLPGSMDYKTMLGSPRIADHDLNNYDSFHETYQHEHLRGGAWTRVYQNAWKDFYSAANMKKILKRTSAEKYWAVFSNFIWYKNALQVEGGHPMIHGFVRRKGRLSRRRDYPVETRRQYFVRRLRDLKETLSGWLGLALEMEEVWLATRRRSALERQVMQEVIRLKTELGEWRTLRLSELQLFYQKGLEALRRSPEFSQGPAGKAPSRLRLWIKKWNVFSDSLTFTRKPMTRFWRKTRRRFRAGEFHRVCYRKAVFTGFRESVLFARFLFSFLSSSLLDKKIS